MPKAQGPIRILRTADGAGGPTKASDALVADIADPVTKNVVAVTETLSCTDALTMTAADKAEAASFGAVWTAPATAAGAGTAGRGAVVADPMAAAREAVAKGAALGAADASVGGITLASRRQSVTETVSTADSASSPRGAGTAAV